MEYKRKTKNTILHKLEKREQKIRDFLSKDIHQLDCNPECGYCLRTSMDMQNFCKDFNTYKIIQGQFDHVWQVWDQCDQKYVTAHFRSLKYNDFLKTKYWKCISSIKKEEVRFCVLCNTDKHLQTHHSTYDVLGCELDNYNEISQSSNMDKLTVLCATCHDGYHKKIQAKK